MSMKTIDESVIENKDDLKAVQTLVSEIKSLHTEIATRETELESKKVQLKERDREIFERDVVAGEYHSSHEYNTNEGVVRVTYKISAKRPLDTINDKPAEEVLRKIFKDSTDTIFKKTPTINVTADEATLLKQVTERPELFRLSLKDLTPDQQKLLVTVHPLFFRADVADVEEYAKVYPTGVTKTTTLRPSNDFLEKLGKLDAVVRKAASKFLKVFFKDTLEPVVVCGNRKQ